MGRIVGAFGTAHILMKRGSAGEAGERVFAGMKEIGRRVRASAPDAVVIISSDHFYNFHLGQAPRFAVAAADMFTPFGDMHLPPDPFPGDAAFARGLAAHAAAEGFGLDLLEDYRPDHGVVIPMLMMGRRSGLPVVPLITNTALEPAPAEGWRLGELLRGFVDTLPPDRRVAVVGTGGLSHWLGVPEMGRVNSAFDNAVMDALTSGQGRRLTAWTAEQVKRDGGNGGLEIVNWLAMAATVPEARGERVYYEALPEWVTGMGGIDMLVREEA